ncbi:DUF5819 family protein [Streptomyces candidus]|uniref:Uncharacterized protein n=1 Tax=Streptomyces candidus TaxID=67283 RepID=A0A7X0HJJ9_9ACTN|nr:DUF5819 family protein [Streptomyces candidus]MBB6437348.1 hypothetical protein [Streptomyces candidus]GHH38679.1 hypothetical protein GCM10018773_17250 [Streptomyces candidus]
MDSYDDKAGSGGTQDAEPSRPGGDPGPTRPSSDPGPTLTADVGTPARPRDRAGMAALSFRCRIVAALALALVGVTALVHLGMVFLHVSPSNTVSKEHAAAVDAWINPEFEQNWKLFAPNPLQQNVAVQARAQIRTESGQWRVTEWIDFTERDAEEIRGSLLPSHTAQNQLRRGWDFYTGWHNDKNESLGMRGDLSERYIRRLVLERMSALDMGGAVHRVQVRSRTTWVKPPPWSKEKVTATPAYRVLPWWTVTPADLTKVAAEAGVTK